MPNRPTDGQRASDTAPTRRAMRGRRIARIVALTAALTATTLVATAGVYVGSVNHSIARADLMRRPTPAPGTLRSTPGALNFIMVGSNTAQGSQNDGASNRILVLHLDKNRRGASLISFPQSTYVKVPGHGMGTIGSAYALGGSKLLANTVETMFNTRMDHMAILDMDNLMSISQQVGLITVNNPEAFTNAGYTFAAGKIKMDGPKALAYVRSRPGDAKGEQAARQQRVVEAGLQRELRPGRLRSPLKLYRFIRATSSSLTLDEGLTELRLARLALSLRMHQDDVDVIRLPLGPIQYVNGKAVQKVDPSRFKELATAVATDKVDGYVAAHPSNQ